MVQGMAAVPEPPLPFCPLRCYDPPCPVAERSVMQMSDYPNPALDPVLQKLKAVALSGRGEHGPLYDQGILAVIGRIECEGSFTPDPFRRAWGVSALQRAKAITPEEVAEVERMCQASGWTLEQGAQ